MVQTQRFLQDKGCRVHVFPERLEMLSLKYFFQAEYIFPYIPYHDTPNTNISYNCLLNNIYLLLLLLFQNFHLQFGSRLQQLAFRFPQFLFRLSTNLALSYSWHLGFYTIKDFKQYYYFFVVTNIRRTLRNVKIPTFLKPSNISLCVPL